MIQSITGRLKHLTWEQRFRLASLIILVAGMFGIGAWVSQQIRDGVIHRTAATTALYIDSVIAPHLQDLAKQSTLPPEQMKMLDELLSQTQLGQQIAALKVWNTEGRIVYSNQAETIGKVFPVDRGLASALNGDIAAQLSDLSNEENKIERELAVPLLEVYSPIRLRGTNQIIAVGEFYPIATDLVKETNAAQQRSWLIFGGVTLVMYALIAGFVRRASNTIERQQTELSNQVTQLKDLLAQNAYLSERVRRAAARTAALNERVLRRISAELHDGPAQDLGLALLRLDNVTAQSEACHSAQCALLHDTEDLSVVKNSLTHALQEVRAISAGMGLPQLGNLSVTDTIGRVIRTHERRTGTQVELRMNQLPEQAPLPVKITLYRVIQEALSNAHRHAGGKDQSVQVTGCEDEFVVQVSDHGAGFDIEQANGQSPTDNPDVHLGLIGMRERVESLGGTFQITSRSGSGTTITAHIPRQVEESIIQP